MESLKKSKKQVDIEELYSFNIKALWRGFKQENISFWFLCLYFLFEYVRPQAVYPVINIFPWGTVTLLLTLISVLMSRSNVKITNPLNKLMFVFAIIVFLSGVFAFSPSASWSYKEAMLSWFLVYFLAIKIVNTERQFFLFIVAYLLLNLKMAQFGTVHWVKSGFAFAHEGLSGAPGWFQNSGEYAIQMLIYGSLAIAFVASLHGYWGGAKKWILYIAASMGFIAVMGASSRGSQFALAIMIVWFMMQHKNGFKGLLVLGVLSFALYNFLPEEQIERFRVVGEDNSSLQRMAYVDAGLEIIKDHPVLGIGYNNWMRYMLYKYPDGVGPGQTIQVSHNIYIQAGSEMGLLGLICFITMIIVAFINNKRTRQMATQLENKLFFNLAHALDAGLIGFLIAGTFVTVLYYPFFWVQITMIVMLNTVTKRSFQKHQENGSNNNL